MAETAVVSPNALELLRKMSSGMVADALAMAGMEGGNGIMGVRPARGFEDAKIVGPASTVRFGKPEAGGPKWTMYRAIRASASGTVLVVDGQGQGQHFTGDNQAACSKRSGIVGNVVYGGARDAAGWREIGQPLWCLGISTVDKPKGCAVIGHNVPINLGGVQVKPGDLIVADEDGVVVIPLELLERVLENLKIIAAVEEGMAKAIQSDAPMEELEKIISKKKPKP